MKKLFTLLIMACGVLLGNAQVTVDKTFIGYRQTGNVSSTQATFTLAGETLFTISTAATDNTLLGSVANVSTSTTLPFENSSYTPIQLGGASTNSGGANFTPIFGDNVTGVSMWAVNSGSASQKITYNGQSYNINGSTTTDDTTTYGKLVEIPLVDNLPINLGNYKLYTLFVITYEETLPVEISGFNADIDNLTSDSAEISVTYSATNVSDETTFTLYYKDSADAEGEYSSVGAESNGGTISLSNLNAATDYVYDIYLAVNDEKVDETITSVEFATANAPTVAWTVNYAEIAKTNIAWGSSINPQSDTNNETYTLRDTSTKFTIGSTTSNYQFEVYKDNEPIIGKNNVTTGGNFYLRYLNNAIGLYNNTSTGNQYGILDLQAGDMVEIATSAEPSALINLVQSDTVGEYDFEYNNGAGTYTFNVYTFNVTNDGNSAFTLKSAYIAYIKVTPAAEVPDTTVPEAPENVNQNKNKDTISVVISSDCELYFRTFISPETAATTYAATSKLDGYTMLNSESTTETCTLLAKDPTTEDDNKTTYTFSTQKLAASLGLSNGLSDLTNGKLLVLSCYAYSPTTETYSSETLFGVSSDGLTTGVDNVTLDETLPVDNRIFNIYGQQVDETYKGIVIRNGKKYFQR